MTGLTLSVYVNPSDGRQCAYVIDRHGQYKLSLSAPCASIAMRYNDFPSPSWLIKWQFIYIHLDTQLNSKSPAYLTEFVTIFL